MHEAGRPVMTLPRTLCSHCRIDPALALFPGLFSSLQKNVQRKSFNLRYEHGEVEVIEASGPEELGGSDLKTILAVLAVASCRDKQYLVSSGQTGDMHGAVPLDDVRQGLGISGAESGVDVIVVPVSIRLLVRELGLAAASNNFNLIKSGLSRLSRVDFRTYRAGISSGSKLIHCAIDPHSEDWLIALSPRLTRVVRQSGRKGSTGTKFARIDMSDVRALNSSNGRAKASSPTHLLHVRLSSWINQGHSRKVHILKLIEYVWRDKANVQAMKKRKQRIRTALMSLERLGWKVSQYEPGKYQISRPLRCA